MHGVSNGYRLVEDIYQIGVISSLAAINFFDRNGNSHELATPTGCSKMMTMISIESRSPWRPRFCSFAEIDTCMNSRGLTECTMG
jgi:hypothetical protein